MGLDKIFGGLFGKMHSPPEVKQVTPLEKVQQSNVSRERVLKEFAKRRRATLLSQLGEANIRSRKLGAA